MAKFKQAPYQNLGAKPTEPKEVFGADVTGLHPTLPSGYKYCLEVVCFFFRLWILISTMKEEYVHYKSTKKADQEIV